MAGTTKNCASPRTKVVRGHQGSNAHNLSRKQRDRQIYDLYLGGKSNAEISQLLGVHRNTVSAAIRNGEPEKDDGTLRQVNRMRKKALDILEAQLDNGDTGTARYVLNRCNILGDVAAPGDTTLNLTIIEEKLNQNRAAGFAAYGLVRAMAPGDN